MYGVKYAEPGRVLAVSSCELRYVESFVSDMVCRSGLLSIVTGSTVSNWRTSACN